MLKTTFSKYILIKIRMTDAYIRLEAKKNDIISMAATTNEACIW